MPGAFNINFQHLSVSSEIARNIKITVSMYEKLPTSILFQPLFGDPENSPADLQQKITIPTSKDVSAVYNFPVGAKVKRKVIKSTERWALELHDTSTSPLQDCGFVDIVLE